jgi:hypothetical protein
MALSELVLPSGIQSESKSSPDPVVVKASTERGVENLHLPMKV